MASKFEKYYKRRLLSSYFSVVLSIGLVLFMLGLLGMLIVNSKKVTDHFKEKIALSIFLKDTAKEVEVIQLTKALKLSPEVRNTVYISKDEAAKKHSQAIGEDFVQFLGTNPLQNGIDVYLNADYVSSTSIEILVDTITSNNFVDEVSYDKPLIDLLNNNIQKISFWILVVSGILGLIAILLINHSIRLTIYAKRFTIKTMQMVGATKAFIRRPFIRLNMKLGIIACLLAVSGMFVVMYYLDKTFPNLYFFENQILLAAVFGGIILVGLFITWISTFFATSRFLGLQTDELYY